MWHAIIIQYFHFLITSYLSDLSCADTYSFRTYTEKACGNSERGGIIIYIVRHACPGVFYNLPCDAISIGDRSISRRVHAPRIAIAHTRMYGMRVCRHTRACACTHTRAYARGAARMRARVSRAYVPTCISVFPRCYANERASRSSTILGRTSSSQRQRFELRSHRNRKCSYRTWKAISFFLVLGKNSTISNTKLYLNNYYMYNGMCDIFGRFFIIINILLNI